MGLCRRVYEVYDATKREWKWKFRTRDRFDHAGRVQGSAFAELADAETEELRLQTCKLVSPDPSLAR